jgi:hypothetical protein
VSAKANRSGLTQPDYTTVPSSPLARKSGAGELHKKGGTCRCMPN